MLGSIIYDMAVSKPAINKNIDEIKVEIQKVNEKIDLQKTLILMSSDTAIIESNDI